MGSICQREHDITVTSCGLRNVTHLNSDREATIYFFPSV